MAIVHPSLYPGAAYEVGRTATGLRGRLLLSDGETPLRWGRVTATLPGGTVVVGRAHGDDRGEFILLVTADATGIGALPASFELELRVYGLLSPVTPSDDALPSKDPLWDLPLEPIPVSPAVDEVSSGELVPSAYVELSMSDGINPAETPRTVVFVPGKLRTDEPSFIQS